jgi:sugar-specific transcriptional regulator TrmB
MDLIQSLKNLGLNEKEAKVYVALLQCPGATAYLIARHSGLKRPTTYVVLEDLIDKGVVTKIPRAKSRNIQP